MFKSIRFRALFWYIVILAATLLSFSLTIYGSFYNTIYGDLDDLLTSRCEGVMNSIDAYWKTEKIHSGQGQSLSKTQEDSAMQYFLNIAEDWVQEKRQDPELKSITVQILNTKGEKMVSSKLMPRIEALDEDDLKDILDGEDSFDTLKGETLEGKRMKFRVYTKPVMENGKAVYIVQVAGPADLFAALLRNLRFILFILFPLVIVLAAIPGVLLIRMTLRPVDKMIDTLRQITAENLKLKIHIPDTRDEVARLAETFNDMIDRLDRSLSSQQRFVANISDEIRTPMSILKTELDNTLSKDCSPDQLKAIISRASEEIKEFSGLMDNLLKVIDFTDSRTTLDIRRVNITRLGERAVNDMKILAEKKAIDISFSSSDTIVLDGDEPQLRQLFLKILDNAIKYTNRNGKVTFTLHRDNQYAKISVSDTGIGIPQDEADFIFDRFYQATNARTAGRGFGLGLSTAKSIVEEHKGEISVESRPGQGSTFNISLPLSYPG